MAFEIRYATADELPQVNELRAQVNLLHARAGRISSAPASARNCVSASIRNLGTRARM